MLKYLIRCIIYIEVLKWEHEVGDDYQITVVTSSRVENFYTVFYREEENFEMSSRCFRNVHRRFDVYWEGGSGENRTTEDVRRTNE